MSTPPDQPAATVTVLCARLEGASTAESERLLRDRAGHHGALAVAAAGDSHVLGFPGARAALRCAVDLQRALPQLRARIGLHAGEPAARDDGGFGRTGLKASRIAALARGGEVVISSVVRELADADAAIGDDIWFEDERDVELPGLPGRHAVVDVRWALAAPRPLSVVVADDSAVVRDGVAAVLRECGIEVVATAADAESLHAAVERHRPDVAIVDIRMPPSRTNEGLVAAERIARTHPDVGVLVLSQYLETAYALELVRGRTARRGYLLKDRVGDIEVLLDALRRVARGGCVIDPAIVERLVGHAAASAPLEQLTAREREVLALIAEGFSNRGIADRLVLSPRTVETHVAQIFFKLGLREEAHEHRRVAAVLTYLRATSAG